jgi:hypothetical protein
MTGLFMLASSFALNEDTQKPHTHVFTSHMVVIVHPGRRSQPSSRRSGIEPGKILSAFSAAQQLHSQPRPSSRGTSQFGTKIPDRHIVLYVLTISLPSLILVRLHYPYSRGQARSAVLGSKTDVLRHKRIVHKSLRFLPWRL